MDNLLKTMNEINKKYKSNVIQQGVEWEPVPKIRFASPRATYMTYGGIPRGKATEFIGPENGGKTTSLLNVIGQAQKQFPDKLAVFFDLENTLDEEWAEVNGVALDKLIIARPNDQTAEQVLQMVLDVIESGGASIVGVDSIPMLVPQQMYDESMDKKSYGGASGVLTEFSRRVSPILNKTNTALVMINQLRDDLNNPYNIYHTPGGRALKHLYSLRLYFARGKYFDENGRDLPNSAENPSGNMVDVRVVKTKVCKPDRRIGQYTLNYRTGVDVLKDTIIMALEYGFLKQSGAWYYLVNGMTGGVLVDEGEEVKFHGMVALVEYLTTQEEIFQEIYEAVNLRLEEQ